MLGSISGQVTQPVSILCTCPSLRTRVGNGHSGACHLKFAQDTARFFYHKISNAGNTLVISAYRPTAVAHKWLARAPFTSRSVHAPGAPLAQHPARRGEALRLCLAPSASPGLEAVGEQPQPDSGPCTLPQSLAQGKATVSESAQITICWRMLLHCCIKSGNTGRTWIRGELLLTD